MQNLGWSPFYRRHELNSNLYDLGVNEYEPALYRVFGPSRREIVQLGYMKYARKGAQKVLDDLPSGTKISWCSLSPSAYKYEACELKSDLIGAYYHLVGRAPKFQFTDS